MRRVEINQGKAENGYLALPKGGKGPGVLVLHAWWGLNDFFRQFCDKLAAEGYIVLAPDMYAGRIATTPDEAEAVRQTINGEETYAFVSDAAKLLTDYPGRTPCPTGKDGIGVIGFSMGAGWAYALEGAIRAVVAYYGAGDPDSVHTEATYLGHYVVGDEWEEDKWVNALEKGLKDKGHEVTFYWYDGVKHWFPETNRPEYNAEAAALAWGRTLDFLKKQIG